jgi:hypothetical protein
MARGVWQRLQAVADHQQQPRLAVLPLVLVRSVRLCLTFKSAFV